jgi:branched-chain amino acid transport system substrate-binding protein
MHATTSSRGLRAPHLVPIGALLAGLSACNADPGPTSQREGTWQAELCVVREPGEIMIGGLYAYSGGAATADTVEKGVLVAIKRINAAGGVFGKTLGLISCDHKQDDARARAQLDELARHPALIGLIGPDTSELAVRLVSDLQAHEMLSIGPCLGAPEISFLNDGGYLFRTRTSNKIVGDVATAVFQKAGVERVFGIYRNDAYGSGNRSVFEAAFAASGGEYGGISYDPTSVGYDAKSIDAAVNFDPQGIYMVGFPAETQAVLLRASAASWPADPPQIVVGAANLFDYGAGDYLEGVLVIHDTPNDSPQARDMLDEYREMWGSEPGVFSDDAFDAAFTLALAAQAAGTASDRRRIRDAMPKTQTGKVVDATEWAEAVKLLESDGEVNYDGVSGPLDYDEHGDATGLTMTESRVTSGHEKVVGCWTAAGDPCPTGS